MFAKPKQKPKKSRCKIQIKEKTSLQRLDKFKE